MMMLPASNRVPAEVSTAKRPRSGLATLVDLLAKVEAGVKGLDLLEQPVDQFLRTADRNRGNVVDRLVRIELGALAAGMRERIHDLALHAEQPELEHRKKANGTRADNDAFCADDGLRCGFAHDGRNSTR